MSQMKTALFLFGNSKWEVTCSC